LHWTDNVFAFQITPEQIKSANSSIYVAFIPTESSLNGYGTLIDKVSLLPMELKACKRGSIQKPGTSISGKEVVTIENGDLDQFDHATTARALTPADVANGNLQDARINRLGQKLTANAIQFDDDFVKFYCDGALIPKGSKWTIELELVLPKTKAIAANQIFFYTKDGEHVDLSQLKLTNAEIPTSGALHDLFDKDRGIFAEIGDLGRASSNSSQTESDYAKECTVRLKIGGNTGTDGIKLKRGGFWVYDRTSDSGLSFRDGFVDFKSSGAVNNADDGVVLYGPYAIKSGQRGCHDDTITNSGPTPAGWWMLAERSGWSNATAPFVWNNDAGRWNRRGNCQQDRATFPYHLDDKKADKRADRSPKIYQGGYSLWDVAGHFDAGHKVYDPETDGAKTPTPIQFKFDLNKMLDSQTSRTDIQIHPDGHNDGTLGCIGLQNYQDAIRVNYLLKHLRATPMNVRGTPSNTWNKSTN